jgi:peroxin-1
VNREVDGKWGEVSSRTDGYSGADLQALVYNAQLEAVHEALGDIGDTTKFGGAPPTTNGATKGTKRTPNFDFFRLGDNVDGAQDDDSLSLKPRWVAERTVLATKLRDMQALWRKQNAQRKSLMLEHSTHQKDQANHSSDSADDPFGEDGAVDGRDGDRSAEPTILWRHVQKSISSTRSSIGPDERKRLQRIYGEFVTGRTGDLPSGESGTEIGGRTSLM